MSCLGFAGVSKLLKKPLRLPALKPQKMPLSLIAKDEDPAKKDDFFGHLDARQPRGMGMN